jgi:hypothetical protein
VPYVQAKVIDVQTGEMLGPQKRGQFYVKSPMLMLGYLREGHEKVKKLRFVVCRINLACFLARGGKRGR